MNVIGKPKEIHTEKLYNQLLKAKDNERIFKTARKTQIITHMGCTIKSLLILRRSLGSQTARDDIFKMLKLKKM